MTSRISVRQRNPDHGKTLKLITTFQKYAQFELSQNEFNQAENGQDFISKRVEELKYDASKTIEALKQKQPVRIPEMRAQDERNQENGKDLAEENKLIPLRKKEFKRPGHFLRYMPIIEGEPDSRYNYDATKEDLMFVAGMKGSPFNIQMFEKLIDIFERENADVNEVRPFVYFQEALERFSQSLQIKDVEKIYEVYSYNIRST